MAFEARILPLALLKRLIMRRCIQELVFDMDGTIADLYGVPDWEPKLRANDPSPYAEAAPMWEMSVLAEHLRRLQKCGIKISVVSWLSKDSNPEYDAKVTAAKMEWLTRHNFPCDEVHIVPYGTPKTDCISNPLTANRHAVLVDDNEGVREGWFYGPTIDPIRYNLHTVLLTLANLAEQAIN